MRLRRARMSHWTRRPFEVYRTIGESEIGRPFRRLGYWQENDIIERLDSVWGIEETSQVSECGSFAKYTKTWRESTVWIKRNGIVTNIQTFHSCEFDAYCSPLLECKCCGKFSGAYSISSISNVKWRNMLSGFAAPHLFWKWVYDSNRRASVMCKYCNNAWFDKCLIESRYRETKRLINKVSNVCRSKQQANSERIFPA